MIASAALGYGLWVATGIALAAFASRWLGNPTKLPAAARSRLVFAAVLGAILGAYALQLPADLLGWSAPPPPGVGGDHLPLGPLGGRTVLGGLLGGLAAVELQKRRLSVHTSTGAAFGLPLALALGCGRLGCLAAGCCAGTACAPAWWTTTDPAGIARVPVQAIEAVFHFGAATLFLVHASRRPARPDRGTGFAAYLTSYGVLRFVLETWREHPPLALGLTWHQYLAATLATIGGVLWWHRLRTAVAARTPSRS